MIKKLKAPVVALILFGLFLFQNIKLSEYWHGENSVSHILFSDAMNYYDYLPATFIRGHVVDQRQTILLNDSTSLNKVTCGVSIFQAPFFLGNCALQKLKGVKYNGYEPSFGYALLVSNSFYVFLGLLMVFYVLKNWFNPLTAITSVLIILYGTNMFHYVYGEAGMSHTYSFFCMAGILYFTDKFYKNPKFGLHFIALISFSGMAVLIRPTNLLMLLIFFGYNCYSISDIKNRVFFVFKNYWIPFGFIVAGILFYVPQMIYWYKLTGSPLIFSYGYTNESFIYLLEPKIGEALFGKIGGWLPYSPLMILMLIALPVMVYQRKNHALVIAIIFVLLTYICASWWATNFLCAFGFRCFIEYYPIFIIPIAYLIFSTLQKKNKWLIGFVFCFIAAGIYFGIRLSLDYRPWPYCFDVDWTWDMYFKLYDKYF